MFAPSLRNNCVFIGRILLAVTVLAFIIATSRAGILTDDSSALGSGVVTGLGCLDDYLFVNADLEYAYYYQTATALNLNLPNEYIYAYQVINHEPFFSEFPLHEFGVSVIQGTVIDSVSYVGVIGGIAPSSIPGHNLGAQSVQWKFYEPNQVDSNHYTDLLYFTSPYGPTRDNAQVMGGGAYNANDDPNNILPFSPIPEPAAGVLMVFCAVALLLRVPSEKVIIGNYITGNRVMIINKLLNHYR